LRNLSSLSLRGCKKITNNGLEALESSTSLTSLNLHGCKRISDKGLEALTKLPMRALSLGLTRVKDEGMAYLVCGGCCWGNSKVLRNQRCNLSQRLIKPAFDEFRPNYKALRDVWGLHVIGVSRGSTAWVV
jgi:hypothetical protein